MLLIPVAVGVWLLLSVLVVALCRATAFADQALAAQLDRLDMRASYGKRTESPWRKLEERTWELHRHGSGASHLLGNERTERALASWPRTPRGLEHTRRLSRSPAGRRPQ
ncbi:MAG TPA: hypothetical protein VIC05_09100 [Solirubrobacteraceae bacterium]|jgi:hypothetical protein